MNQLDIPPGPSPNQKQRPGSSWAMGLLAIPLMLCCGLPLVVAGLATVSSLTKGILVGVIVAVVGTASALIARRSMRNNATCCAPPARPTRSSAPREVEHRS